MVCGFRSIQVRSVSTDTVLRRARHSPGFLVFCLTNQFFPRTTQTKTKVDEVQKKDRGGIHHPLPALPSCGPYPETGGGWVLCPKALPRYLMSAHHPDRKVRIIIPWCWNRWICREYVCTLQMKEQRVRTQVKAPWNPDESEAQSRTGTLKWPRVWLALQPRMCP